MKKNIQYGSDPFYTNGGAIVLKTATAKSFSGARLTLKFENVEPFRTAMMG